MQILTKSLYSGVETLRVDGSNNNIELNCLLYGDDLKLLAREKVTPSNFLWKTEYFFAEI